MATSVVWMFWGLTALVGIGAIAAVLWLVHTIPARVRRGLQSTDERWPGWERAGGNGAGMARLADRGKAVGLMLVPQYT